MAHALLRLVFVVVLCWAVVATALSDGLSISVDAESISMVYRSPTTETARSNSQNGGGQDKHVLLLVNSRTVVNGGDDVDNRWLLRDCISPRSCRWPRRRIHRGKIMNIAAYAVTHDESQIELLGIQHFD